MEPVPQDTGLPVSERILRWAARCPHRPAVVQGRYVLTYGELAAKVGMLVGRLRALGAGQDTVVALYLPKSAELVLAATAALVAGSAYLVLDVDQPFPTTRRMLRESGARQLVTMSKLWSINGDAGPVPIYLDKLEDDGDPPIAPPPPEPHSLAYVMYPQGSCGVLIEHAGLSNLVEWYTECHRVTPYDRMTLLGPPSSDDFALEVWPCLANGAALHIVDGPAATSATLLADWLCYHGTTVCFMPTPLVDAVLAAPWAAPVRLRLMLVNGDALPIGGPAELPFALRRVFRHPQCTVAVAYGEVPTGQGGEAPPEGRAIAGLTDYVLDARGHSVPDGQPGALHVTGPGLARGGPADPFVPNPFSVLHGARMFPTGDLVSRSSGGVLHFLGRVGMTARG